MPEVREKKNKEGTRASDSGEPMPRMMDMCADMLGAMRKTTDMATFATPEIHRLFEGWLATLEAEALKVLRERGEMAASPLAESLGISEEAATYLVARLKNQGKIDLRAQIV